MIKDFEKILAKLKCVCYNAKRILFVGESHNSSETRKEVWL